MDQGTVFYICTHGRFGEEIVKSAEMIYDRLDDVKVFSLLPGMSPEEYNACIEKELIKDCLLYTSSKTSSASYSVTICLISSNKIGLMQAV